MRESVAAAMACCVWLIGSNAHAAFPERPLRYVLASAAGGGPDVAARIIMAELSRQTGQQVIVDNRPGASGIVGTEVIVRATADREIDDVERHDADVEDHVPRPRPSRGTASTNAL